jgi:diacylglycerol kinase family enzyme
MPEETKEQMAKPEEALRYGIIVNPAAGMSSLKRRKQVIAQCAGILGRETLVDGWDTESAAELRECAGVLSGKVDVIVVAGGDGTFSDIINALHRTTVLAYIPLGTGNAWRNTLGLPFSVRRAAERIKNGWEHLVDLILVDGKTKGILASVGFEGRALSERKKFLEKGVKGFDSYFRAIAKLILAGYEGDDAIVKVDRKTFSVKRAVSLIVTKTPYYGFGLKVVPKARIDDGLLHVMMISADPSTTLSNIVASSTSGNAFGQYLTCKRVSIKTMAELPLQVDGNLEREGTSFKFQVLSSALRMRY